MEGCSRVEEALSQARKNSSHTILDGVSVLVIFAEKGPHDYAMMNTEEVE